MAGRPVRISGGKVHEGPRPDPGDEWVDEGRVSSGRSSGAGRPARRSPSRRSAPEVHVEPLAPLVGAARAASLEPRIRKAAEAFHNERYVEARRLLRPIAAEAPEAASVRELLGLVHYRLGKWKEAIAELEAFRELADGSTEQHPVLADCYRALRRWRQVDELWAELREASPSSELVNEGRIVAAGALADQGRLADAIRLLEKGWRTPAKPKEHHLRRAYALADLYERAGDLPRARSLFGWIARIDPDLADVVERLESLG